MLPKSPLSERPEPLSGVADLQRKTTKNEKPLQHQAEAAIWRPRPWMCVAVSVLLASLSFETVLAERRPGEIQKLAKNPADQLRQLDYDSISASDLPRSRELQPAPKLQSQFEALHLDRGLEGYEANRRLHKPPPLKKTYFSPSWQGSTGGMDMPWAYVLPEGDFVVALGAKKRRVSSDYWPTVYQKIEGIDRSVTVNYGLLGFFELTAVMDNQNREFRYAAQNDFITGLPLAPAVFRGDKTFKGFGAKGAYSTDDFQIAVGIFSALFDNQDRNTFSFFDYDRLQTIYAVGSTQVGKTFAGHLSAKYVTYDWEGSIYPSGATDGSPVKGGPPNRDGGNRRGFGPALEAGNAPVFQLPDGSLTQDGTAPGAVAVGKGTTNWFNIGMGLDAEVSKNFRVLFEVNGETGVDFNGIGKWFFNVGGRYERTNWSATLGLRHVGAQGYREPVLSLAYRF